MPNRDFLVDQPGQSLQTRSVPVKIGRLVNVSVYNVTKLYFQANVCKAFDENKSSTIVET